MEIISKFLDVEALLSPTVYEKLKDFEKEKLDNLIQKIREFKKYNDKFILLDEKFLEIFLQKNLDEIINEYKGYNFILYYTGEEPEEVKEEIKKEIEEKIEFIKREEKEQFVKKSDEDVEEKLKQLISKEEKKEDFDAERAKRYENITKIRESVSSRIKWIAKDIDAIIEIYDDSDVSGKSTCTGTIEDFVKYFRDRFERLKVFIERKAQRKRYPLKDIKKMKGQKDAFVVGIVSDVDTAKNGNLIVRIEDIEDELTLILPKSRGGVF